MQQLVFISRKIVNYFNIWKYSIRWGRFLLQPVWGYCLIHNEGCLPKCKWSRIFLHFQSQQHKMFLAENHFLKYLYLSLTPLN